MEIKTMSMTRTDDSGFSIDKKGDVTHRLCISTTLFTVLTLTTSAMTLYADVPSSICENTVTSVYVAEENTATDTIPVSEKIQKVLSFYNLGKSHLSKILGISRPSLYAWIEGNSEPSPQNFAKIEQLYSIIGELGDTDDKSIHHGFIDNALPGQNKSLYQLFVENNNLKTQEIKNLVQNALMKSISRMENINKRRNFEYDIAHSDAEKELTFEENL